MEDAAALKVLIVEDLPSDAELMVLRLESEGFRFEWRRVQTEPEYLAALDARPELILADWHLPQFSGQRALQLLRERGLKTPFIIVSGGIGEEAAVDALRQGASDYVLKDRPARLGPAVRRALEEAAERLRAEGALRESDASLQLALDAGQLGSWELDLATGKAWHSLRHDQIFGYDEPLPEWGYETFLRHVVPEDREGVDRSYRAAIAAGSSWHYECRIRRGDGALRWIEGHGGPFRNSDGRFVRLLGTVADITERKQAEAERQALHTAEATSKAKSEFLASMSHELRTPLNAILGYAQILRQGPGLSERQAQSLNAIHQSGQHLLTLINDLLDLARIEAGKLELCPTDMDLSAFLPAVAGIVRLRAEEKALLFSCKASRELPAAVQADEKRLRQTLLNLLDNAVKFTDRGEVELKLLVLAREEGTVQLRFEVVDTGVGIAPEQLEVIFHPFEQVGEVQRRAAGTGLGLAISRQLVQLMGSQIQVISRPGAGSRFWFDLSLPVVEATAPARPAAPVATGYEGQRRTVLIVDDVAGNRALLVDLLEGLGFDLRQAANGLEAIEQVQAAAPDLVMMDLLMPVLDGQEAIRRIRRLPGRERLPIIAVSASADLEHETGSLAAGADSFLSKPIEQDSLLDRIGLHLGLTWTCARQPPAPIPVAGDDPAALVIPSREEMEVLHQLALTGDMRAIRERAAHLAALDPGYRPFAERLQRLAQGYQSKAILRIVSEQLARR